VRLGATAATASTLGAVPDASNPEAAVRLYLTYLSDPSALVDQDELARARAAYESESDVIAKLRLAAELDRLQAPDPAAVVKRFVANAKVFADQEDIPAAAFLELGVPADVLAEAGFDVPARRAAVTRAARAPRASRATGAPRVTSEQVRAAALAMPRHFTLTDVSAKAGGGSPATIRKVVDELVESGRVAKLGPVPNWTERGRPPMQYELR
jgi:hypothetical protein